MQLREQTRVISQSGFTLVELMVVIAIVAMLAAIAVPQLLGAREKARHGACLDAYHVLDGELTNNLETFEAIGHEAPAEAAIDALIERLEAVDNVRNPRNLAEAGYAAAEGPAFVPTSETSCRVFMYDASDPGLDASPAIVITNFERGVNSFRIALD